MCHNLGTPKLALFSSATVVTQVVLKHCRCILLWAGHWAQWPPEVPSGLNYPVILSCHKQDKWPRTSLTNNLISSLQVQIAVNCLQLNLLQQGRGKKAAKEQQHCFWWSTLRAPRCRARVLCKPQPARGCPGSDPHQPGPCEDVPGHVWIAPELGAKSLCVACLKFYLHNG